jgi:hypothetical protein
MHMATWTDLLHMAIDRRRQRRKQRAENGAAKPSGDFGASANTTIFWACSALLVAFLMFPHVFALASVTVAPCLGVILVIGALTGGLGHIHRALIEKPASERLSALIRHRG